MAAAVIKSLASLAYPNSSQTPLVFPVYLFRAPLFRRSPPTSSSSSTILTCSKCRTHLTPTTSIVSKTFTGRHGRAFLLSPTSFASSQVIMSPPQQRQLSTGVHTVSDFACVVCGETLGWRYDDASEEGQKYKIGKWILERERVGVVEDDDDDDDDEEEDGIVEKEVRALMEMPDVDFGIREERERLFRGY